MGSSLVSFDRRCRCAVDLILLRFLSNIKTSFHPKMELTCNLGQGGASKLERFKKPFITKFNRLF
jgi:hypothetical protein